MRAQDWLAEQNPAGLLDALTGFLVPHLAAA